MRRAELACRERTLEIYLFGRNEHDFALPDTCNSIAETFVLAHRRAHGRSCSANENTRLEPERFRSITLCTLPTSVRTVRSHIVRAVYSRGRLG